MEKIGLRWAVNCSSWVPSKQEWLAALAHIQPEERQRISKFVFRKDAKLALVGRLLMRACLADMLNVEPKQLHFTRGVKGKPQIISSEVDYKLVGFNVSHQGDYAVFAAQTDSEVGVDVMQLSSPRGEDVLSFFRTMARQFTVNEWKQIETPHLSHQRQLHNFYRFWCLKESFIKAEGTGLSFGLQNLEFIVDPDQDWPPPLPGDCYTGTKLYIRGQPAPETWIFQESLLDKQHCVSVAIRSEGIKSQTPIVFSVIAIRDLLDKLHPPTTPTINLLQFWEEFRLKRESPISVTPDLMTGDNVIIDR